MFGIAASGLAAPPQAPYSLGAPPLDLPLDVPVYKAIFDSEGRFCGLTDQPIDYVRRLPRIIQLKDAFALYTENNGMAPRFEQGDIFYAAPGHPPKPGDYVVIELLSPIKQPSDYGYLKRLISIDAHTVIVEQFNPTKRFELAAAEVKAIFRIIPWNELVGA